VALAQDRCDWQEVNPAKRAFGHLMPSKMHATLQHDGEWEEQQQFALLWLDLLLWLLRHYFSLLLRPTLWKGAV
jgi:hypothetical protein